MKIIFLGLMFLASASVFAVNSTKVCNELSHQEATIKIAEVMGHAILRTKGYEGISSSRASSYLIYHWDLVKMVHVEGDLYRREVFDLCSLSDDALVKFTRTVCNGSELGDMASLRCRSRIMAGLGLNKLK